MLIILGIDPGTTVGYAMLSPKKKILKVGSSKELALDALLKISLDYGKAIIVSCDKAKIPSFVQKFAVKTGARKYHPKEDVKAEEKRLLTKPYFKYYKNAHEQDALASALLAYKKYEGLFLRIKKSLQKLGKEEILESVIDLVIRKKFSIAGAIEVISNPKTEEKQAIKRVTEDRPLRSEDFARVYNRLIEEEEKNKEVKKQLSKTNRENRKLKSKLKKVLTKISKETDEKVKEKIGIKEEKIEYYQLEIKRQKNKISELESELRDMTLLMGNLNNKVIAKKLVNLGYNELLAKSKVFTIHKNDILFVDDANELSEKALKTLKNKVRIIIVKKKLSRKNQERLISDFTIIDSSKIKYSEHKLYAIVDKQSLDKELNSKKLLRNIVKAYKSKRQV